MSDCVLPQRLRGDGPCADCASADNIVWFTDNSLWNEVMSWPGPIQAGDPGGILCIPCFIKRVHHAGLNPRGWRLLPEWRWEARSIEDYLPACEPAPTQVHELDPESLPPAGTVFSIWNPVEPPDPHCLCGALWLDDGCARDDPHLYPGLAPQPRRLMPD